jgi:hypothetical protein
MLNGNERIIKHKAGLLNLVEELANVSRLARSRAFQEPPSTATRMPWMKVALRPKASIAIRVCFILLVIRSQLTSYYTKNLPYNIPGELPKKSFFVIK